jgi:rod shape-determining protein MreC
VSSELTSRTNKERAALIMIPMLVLQLALLSLQIEDTSGTMLFKTWTLALQAPILSASSGISNGVKDVWRNYIWMVGARAENEHLKQTVNRLLLENNAYVQIQQENARLRQLLLLNESIAIKSVGARVIARVPDFLSNLVYINRGSADGVRADAAVLCSDGIIGRVILVSKNESQVQLITNPDASAGVILERTRTPGVLKGSGGALLDMAYVGNVENVEVGDIVLTSGLDGIYPNGLPIGKVVDSRKGKGVFRTIKVEPRVDLIRLEEVSVLLALPDPEKEMAVPRPELP